MPSTTAIDNRFNAIDNRFDAMDLCIRSLHGEFLILAAVDAPLYDPTRPGQLEFLAAPNPTSRDNLLTFDCEIIICNYHILLFNCNLDMQCVNSAAALGLPPLPLNADLSTRKRQIPGRLGIAMGLMG